LSDGRSIGLPGAAFKAGMTGAGGGGAFATTGFSSAAAGGLARASGAAPLMLTGCGAIVASGSTWALLRTCGVTLSVARCTGWPCTNAACGTAVIAAGRCMFAYRMLVAVSRLL
jgi:hypothetical protein